MPFGVCHHLAWKGWLKEKDTLCEMLGYTCEDLMQTNLAAVTHPDDLTQFNRVLAGEIDGYTLDKRFVRKDGRVINMILAGALPPRH